MKSGSYFVYILTNFSKTVFYIGVTNDLVRRVFEHQHELIPGFSQKYKLHILVYFEEFSSVREAIAREKQHKNWHREWKLNLVKSVNPDLKDLSKAF